MGTEKIKFGEKWKTCVMLICFSLLILAMGIFCLRYFTARKLIIKHHVDNAWTQMVFADNPLIKDNLLKKPKKKVEIDWKKKYPFEQQDKEAKKTMFTRLQNKQKAKEQKIERKFHKQELEDWTSKYFLAYREIFEAGRSYEKIVGWNVINPSMSVAVLDDGYLTSVSKRKSQTERIQSVSNFQKFAESYGIKFFFVQAPHKTNPNGDLRINNHLDFANQNADELLQGLTNAGVSVLDLRDKLISTSDDASWHELFYRTDHHWKPQTAIKAAGIVAEKLHTNGIEVDNTHFTPVDYDWILYPGYFLGSQGKKVTLSKTNPDNFEIAEPYFTVNWHLYVPAANINKTGGFYLIYDHHQLERLDYYNLNPYAAYSYGDQPIMYFTNLNMSENGQKVLAITDSYGDTMIPFLAVGVREIIKVDLRHFTGSLQKLLLEEKPDVVFVMYTPGYDKDIDWNSHEDEFDFR